MAMPLVTELTPQRIVHDCVDKLAAFKNAPRQLLQPESALFKAADLVFTGGRSFYEAKRRFTAFRAAPMRPTSRVHGCWTCRTGDWSGRPDRQALHLLPRRHGLSPYLRARQRQPASQPARTAMQCNAQGGFGLTCEITYSPHKPLPVDGEALVQRCIDDCVRVGIIGADDPVWVSNQVDMPCAYVVSDHAWAVQIEIIREWMNAADIVLTGR